MAQFFAATTRCRRRGAEIGSNFAAHKAKTKPQPYGHGFCVVVKEGQYLQLAFQYSREHNASVRHPSLFASQKDDVSSRLIYRKAVTAYRQSLLFMG